MSWSSQAASGHEHSSGIDMAPRLVELLADADTACAIQLLIEYDPQPPFDCGSLIKAGKDVRRRAAQLRR